MSEEKLRDPRVWGPPFWKVYDILVATYPSKPSQKQRRAMKRYFQVQKYLIPCETCAKNYRSIYSKYPPQVHSKEAMQAWLKILKSEVGKHKRGA